MKQKKQSKSYSAPALEKGLDILELLSNFEDGLSQAEIASRLNKSVNEIYRMISTLRDREYVDFDEDEDRYNLSYKILNMTAKFEPVKNNAQASENQEFGFRTPTTRFRYFA